MLCAGRVSRVVLSSIALFALQPTRWLQAQTPDTSPAPPKLRLEGSARPRKQAVELTIVPGQETFSGTTEIEADLMAPTSVLWLNGRELKIRESSFSVGNAATAVRVVPGGEDFVGFAFEKPVGPGPARLRIAFEGVLNRRDTEGLFAQQEGGDWYVFTQFEALAARRAFPGFDEPSYKIPWTVRLRVPKDLVALSNAPQSGEKVEGDLKLVSFAETPPMPSYLVAVAVGPFELVDAGKTSRGGAPIRIVTPRGRGREARWAVETTATIVKLLEDYFDSPYPYAKLDQVTVPIPVAFGAMENAGLVTYSQNILLRRPEDENITFRRGYATAAAHELAHMWFGDLVTMAWWDDLWLNEGFASWMAAKVVDRWKPEWDVKIGGVSSRGFAMSQDSLATARKIRQPIHSSHDIVNAFDGITYVKGQSILQMFEAWLGEEVFRQGVRQYLDKHRWGNATAADFVAALSSASGRDIAAPFSTFLEQTGVPSVSAELVCGGGKPRLALAQKPYRPLGSKDTSTKTWQIPVCFEHGGGSGARQCTLLREAATEVPLDPAQRCPAWLHPNDEGSGYYHVMYRGGLLSRQLEDGGKRLSMAERVALLQDLTALVRSGDVKAADALGVVPVMLQDPSRHLVSATATLVGVVTRGDVVPESARPKLARFVRETYGERARALGWRAQPGEDEDTRLLRRSLVSLVAITGEDPALASEAVALARRWLEDPKAIDPDMLAVALSTAGRNGDRALFESFRDAAKREKDRLRRQRMLDLLGSFRDPQVVKEALWIPLDDAFDIREADGILFSAMSEPRTRDMAWTFLKQNVDAIVDRMPREVRGDLAFLAISFCDAERRAGAESFLKPRVADFPGGPRKLTQVLERIELCIAFKDAQQASVLSFLEKY